MVFLWCRGYARKGWRFLKEEWSKFIKGFIEKLTWDPNLRSGSILAVLIHSLLRSPANISLFVSPCPLECYLQKETKIEPDLRLFKSKFLQTLIEHCLPLLFCQRVHLKKWTRKTCRTFFEFGLPVVSHVYVYPNKPPPPIPLFRGVK